MNIVKSKFLDVNSACFDKTFIRASLSVFFGYFLSWVTYIWDLIFSYFFNDFLYELISVLSMILHWVSNEGSFILPLAFFATIVKSNSLDSIFRWRKLWKLKGSLIRTTNFIKRKIAQLKFMKFFFVANRQLGWNIFPTWPAFFKNNWKRKQAEENITASTDQNKVPFSVLCKKWLMK